MGLFTELFASARAASRDPSACAISGSPVLQADGESSLDRYCNLFAIVHFAALDLGNNEDPAFISRERIGLLGEFARSSSAPPELTARPEAGSRAPGNRERGGGRRDPRRTGAGPGLPARRPREAPAGSARLSAILERELSSGRLAPPSGASGSMAWSAWTPRPDRVAAEAWTRGLVPLDVDDGDAGAFARALDPERVRASEPLRAALRRARDLPAASLEAATALASAADPGSAGSLVTALLETCPACQSPAALAALFGPLGEEGLEALARLAEETLPFGASPLEALFELEPVRAEELGRARLAAALARGCVPDRSCRRSWPTASTRSPVCWRPFRTGDATGRA